MKHTPGPWKIVGGNVIVTLAYTAPNLASVEVKGSPNSKLVQANARLISAAPELLENFEKAIRLIEHIQEKHGLVYECTIRDGYKLIAKATGGAE